MTFFGRWSIRIGLLSALGYVCACSDPGTAPPARLPAEPRHVLTYYGDYPPTHVLTSTGDTCPGYTVPAAIETSFWSGTDSEWLSNPDSVAAADSLITGDQSYTAPLSLLDPSTSTELYAGPCEALYNRCVARCKRLGTRRQRALCYAGCMARYAECLADETVDRYFPPPNTCPKADLIYDPADAPTYEGGQCDTGNGGGSSGGNYSCHTQWIVIETDDGTGWRTYWQGYATVCG